MISKDTLKQMVQFFIIIVLFLISLFLIENNIVKYLSSFFWGLILLIYLIAFLPDFMLNWVKNCISTFTKNKRIENADPPKIKIEKAESIDNEVQEEWFRVCNKEFQQFHGVSAIRSNHEKFPWSVYFSVGEFIQEEGLDKAIYEALLNTPKVTEVYREDQEVFTLVGNPNGRDLVKSVSKVIDKYIVKYNESHSKT